MARMAGKACPLRCPACRAELGPDCIGKGLAKRQVKRAERRQWERESDEEIAQDRDADIAERRREAYDFYVRTHWAMQILRRR